MDRCYCFPYVLSSTAQVFLQKYSTYRLMDDASDTIVHFELVQVSLYADNVTNTQQCFDNMFNLYKGFTLLIYVY